MNYYPTYPLIFRTYTTIRDDAQHRQYVDEFNMAYPEYLKILNTLAPKKLQECIERDHRTKVR